MIGTEETLGSLKSQVLNLIHIAAATVVSMPWVTLGLRYSDIRWGTDDLALVSEWWWKTRRTRVWLAQPGDPTVEPELILDRS